MTSRQFTFVSLKIFVSSLFADVKILWSILRCAVKCRQKCPLAAIDVIHQLEQTWSPLEQCWSNHPHIIAQALLEPIERSDNDLLTLPKSEIVLVSSSTSLIQPQTQRNHGKTVCHLSSSSLRPDLDSKLLDISMFAGYAFHNCERHWQWQSPFKLSFTLLFLLKLLQWGCMLLDKEE